MLIESSSPSTMRRSWFALNRATSGPRGQLVAAALIAALACSLVSLARGQDAGWDVLNYHVYTPWSWINARLSTDLAPAQLQSYFSPLLDCLWFALVEAGTPKTAALFLGAVQSTIFLFVALIVEEVMRDVHDAQAGTGHALARRHTWPLLFGTAALASAPVYHTLGSAMGDATSAVPVLAALWAVLRALRASARGELRWVILAGATLGLSEACKLTNAPAAVALACALLLAQGRPLARRATLVFAMTTAAVIAFAIAAGPWLFTVAHAFGNPFFPQGTRWFPSALTTAVTVGDTRWGPHGWLDAVTWPIRLTLEPRLGGEVPMRQLVWLMLELVLLAFAVATWRQRRIHDPAAFKSRGAAFVVIAFVTIGFATWSLLFGVHRYLVAEEALAPFAIMLVVLPWLRSRRRQRLAAALVGIAAITPLFESAEWGHEPFADVAYRVTRPAVDDPSKVSVLLVGFEPQAWRLPFLWEQAAYAGVGGNFPEAAGYVARIDAIVLERPHSYAMLSAASDPDAVRFADHEAIAARWRLDRGEGCRALHWLAQRAWHADVEDLPGACRLIRREAERPDIPELDRRTRQAGQAILRQRGFTFEEGACRTVDSFVGSASYPFQWCPVHRLNEWPLDRDLPIARPMP